MTFSTLGTMASYVPKQGVTGTVDLSTATVVKGAGMDLITPTSVAGSGVTLSGGKVSFSAATAVSTNGCFSAAYDNYLVLMDFSAASVSDNLALRLRLAGTDAATAYITGLTFTSFNSNAGGFNGSALGVTGFLGLYNHTSGGAARVNIFSPALARKTIFTADGGNFEAAGNGRTVQGEHTTATAYDGFSVLPSSGNVTGSLRVYGMRNS